MNVSNKTTFQMCENGTCLSYFLNNGISVRWHIIIGVNSPIPLRSITSICITTLLQCGDIFVLLLIFKSVS
jgi:hypothetical protein